MKKMLFFVNPAAGKEEMRYQLMDVIDFFTASGYDVLCHPTQKPLDIPEFLRERGQEFDMVVTCGGDGTLNDGIRPDGAGAPANAGLHSCGNGQ